MAIKEIEANLNIDNFSANDSTIKANIIITNNSSEKIYLPTIKIDTSDLSLNYHFFILEIVYTIILGVTENFFGVLDLGAWIELKELLPNEVKKVAIRIIKKDLTHSDLIKSFHKTDIHEIVFMFDFIQVKKAKKIIQLKNGKKMIKATDYWDNCISVRSKFQYPAL